ncbi:MAG: hypothetical protein MJZ99_11690 [Bacteroidales bacterium]|nr:hypothetical protein [Bacteroidales bacterium]
MKEKLQYQTPVVYSYAAKIELGFAGSMSSDPQPLIPDASTNERVNESTTYFF